MKCKTKHLKSARVGRFKVSLLMHKTEAREWESVAISYGKKVDGEWRNQNIICSALDFRSLKDAIEKFDELGVGERSPSNFLAQGQPCAEVAR